MIAYLLCIAIGALVASLWWLLRMRRAVATWRQYAGELEQQNNDADRLLKQSEAQVIRLLKELRRSGHPGFQDPEFADERQNGRRKGVRS